MNETQSIDREAGIHFCREAERMTNEANLEDVIALYAPDAVAEWVINGVSEHHEGKAAIADAFAVLVGVWRVRNLRVEKTLESFGVDTIVLSWRGGFRGDDHQFGVEIWTLRDGLVVRHQMYGFLDVRPSTSVRASARIALASPGLATTVTMQRLKQRAKRQLRRK